MSLYKFVSPDAALRYLKNQSLRITPPDQFNDPFEMRPSYTLNAKDLLKQAPEIVREELVAVFSKEIKAKFSTLPINVDVFSNKLAAFLMKELSTDDEREFLLAVKVIGADNASEMLNELRRQFDLMLRNALASAEAQVPVFSQVIQSAMHNALPRLIGVLCLCASPTNPLMWAHYADSHKGARLEFDNSAPCFNRRRGDADDFGYFRRVGYSELRPAVDSASTDDAFVSLALTKALEWAYEQEHRLLWPLTLADRRIDGGENPIHLIDVPATSLLSVTLGCRSSDAFQSAVIQSLSELRSDRKIVIRNAVLDEKSFTLKYIDVG